MGDNLCASNLHAEMATYPIPNLGANSTNINKLMIVIVTDKQARAWICIVADTVKMDLDMWDYSDPDTFSQWRLAIGDYSFTTHEFLWVKESVESLITKMDISIIFLIM